MGYTKKSETAARFTDLSGQQVTDEGGSPLANDTIDRETQAILRFRNGYLDGGDLPAVECDDFHLEYYKGGRLHRDDGPAVVSDYGNVREFWKNGHRVSGPRGKGRP